VHQYRLARACESADDKRYDLGFARTADHALGRDPIAAGDGLAQLARGPFRVDRHAVQHLLNRAAASGDVPWGFSAEPSLEI